MNEQQKNNAIILITEGVHSIIRGKSVKESSNVLIEADKLIEIIQSLEDVPREVF